jgi:hypothetical protein
MLTASSRLSVLTDAKLIYYSIRSHTANNSNRTVPKAILTLPASRLLQPDDESHFFYISKSQWIKPYCGMYPVTGPPFLISILVGNRPSLGRINPALWLDRSVALNTRRGIINHSNRLTSLWHCQSTNHASY